MKIPNDLNLIKNAMFDPLSLANIFLNEKVTLLITGNFAVTLLNIMLLLHVSYKICKMKYIINCVKYLFLKSILILI